MPYHPPLKIGSARLFWPKIGHWEKMRYMLKMISTGLFAIDLALIYPKHNPEGPWHPPDTQQTPSRQRKIHIFWLKIGHWEKMKYMLKTVVIGLFSIDFVFLPPRQYPDSPRHHLDTPQTPHRHPTDTLQTPQNIPFCRGF